LKVEERVGSPTESRYAGFLKPLRRLEMDFNVRTATFDGFGGAVVSVEGELDVATAAALAEPAEVVVNIGCPLILDLSECSFINSVGLRFVQHLHNALTEVGEAMALVTDHSQTRKLLSLTAIDQSVRIFKTRRAAIAWTGNQKESVRGGAAPPLNAAINWGPSTASPASP
jgi:anti-sigma B factor antagonist